MRGSPIRKSSDQRSVDSSPRLIAASYVLHRLLVPRHPPCALNNLATQKTPHNHPRKEAIVRAYKNSSLRVRRCSRPLCSSQRTTSHPPHDPARHIRERMPVRDTGRPCPKDQRSPAPSGPNSVPTTRDPISTTFPARPRTSRTSGDYQAPAELVSVPPSSTTPDTRGPSRMTNRPDPGAALDHFHEESGQCSLERR